MKRYKSIFLESKQKAIQILKKALPDFEQGGGSIKPFVDKLASADPSNSFKYTELFANIIANIDVEIKNQPSERYSFIGKLFAIIGEDTFKKRLYDFEKKNIPIDIYKIKTWDEFIKILERSEEQISKSKAKKGLVGLKKDKDYIELPSSITDTDLYDDNIKAYIPLSYKASKIIASSYVGNCEGKWCTAYQKTDEYWNSYIAIGGGILVYIVNYSNEIYVENSNKKFAIYFYKDKKNKEIFDANDKPINRIEFGTMQKDIEKYVYQNWNKIKKMQNMEVIPEYLYLEETFKPEGGWGIRDSKEAMEFVRNFLIHDRITLSPGEQEYYLTTKSYINEMDGKFLIQAKFKYDDIKQYVDLSTMDSDNLERYTIQNNYLKCRLATHIWVSPWVREQIETHDEIITVMFQHLHNAIFTIP